MINEENNHLAQRKKSTELFVAIEWKERESVCRILLIQFNTRPIFLLFYMQKIVEVKTTTTGKSLLSIRF